MEVEMGKRNVSVPANWADFAFSGAQFAENLASASAVFFQNLALTFAAHSAYKDDQKRVSLRTERFQEEAGLEIERITRGN